MTDQIVTRSSQFDRGIRARVIGRGIDDHEMNIGSPAIVDWQAGWRFADKNMQDEAHARFFRFRPQAQVVKVSPP